MKYLILDHKNVIFYISDTIDYQENGNPLVDYGTLAIAEYLVKKVIELLCFYTNTQELNRLR